MIQCHKIYITIRYSAQKYLLYDIAPKMFRFILGKIHVSLLITLFCFEFMRSRGVYIYPRDHEVAIYILRDIKVPISIPIHRAAFIYPQRSRGASLHSKRSRGAYIYPQRSRAGYIYLSVGISRCLYLSLKISMWLYLSLQISRWLYLSIEISRWLHLFLEILISPRLNTLQYIQCLLIFSGHLLIYRHQDF